MKNSFEKENLELKTSLNEKFLLEQTFRGRKPRWKVDRKPRWRDEEEEEGFFAELEKALKKIRVVSTEAFVNELSGFIFDFTEHVSSLEALIKKVKNKLLNNGIIVHKGEIFFDLFENEEYFLEFIIEPFEEMIKYLEQDDMKGILDTIEKFERFLDILKKEGLKALIKMGLDGQLKKVVRGKLRRKTRAWGGYKIETLEKDLQKIYDTIVKFNQRQQEQLKEIIKHIKGRFIEYEDTRFKESDKKVILDELSKSKDFLESFETSKFLEKISLLIDFTGVIEDLIDDERYDKYTVMIVNTTLKIVPRYPEEEEEEEKEEKTARRLLRKIRKHEY